MRRGFAALGLGVALFAVGTASAEDMSGNTQFLIGQRYLRDKNWGALDRPSPSGSPVHVALGVMVSGESGTATATDPEFGQVGSGDSRFFEFSTGFLYHPVKKAVVRPYLGAGALLLTASTASDWGLFKSSNDGDQSFGFYGNLGIFFKVGEHFNIGVDGRIVRGTTITLNGIKGDGGSG